jgi:hypothetical protein
MNGDLVVIKGDTYVEKSEEISKINPGVKLQTQFGTVGTETFQAKSFLNDYESLYVIDMGIMCFPVSAVHAMDAFEKACRFSKTLKPLVEWEAQIVERDMMVLRYKDIDLRIYKYLGTLQKRVGGDFSDYPKDRIM